MIKLTTAPHDEKPPVLVEVRIDGDGDARILLNNITVAYISSRSGKLHRTSPALHEAKQLEAAGFETHQGMLAEYPE